MKYNGRILAKSPKNKFLNNMKLKLLLSLFLFSLISANAQTRRDIFDSSVEITWLGIDLSKAKLIGDRERYGSESDMRKLAEGWNDIFLKEPEKFNVARSLGRTQVKNAIEVTGDHNQQLDILSQYTDNKDEFGHMKLSDVDEVVADYDFSGLSGIGLMFIVESFSKPNGKASVWVTFINMDTKEVLLTEKLMGDPGGAGLRNYWANACYDILQKMKAKDFPRWRKAYSGN
jgi:hypothetical protein